MSREWTQIKVRLPDNVVKQIQNVSSDPVDKVLQDAISHYLATHATETMIAYSVTQYVNQTENMFEKYFDHLTNLMASLSYVSKFNNNILNAVFINNGGKEEDLEKLYNEATDTVQKYFYFEDNDEAVLPIMEENDQLKLKVKALEEKQSSIPDIPGPIASHSPSPNASPNTTDSGNDTQEKMKKVIEQKEQLEEQKKEIVNWINGLILYMAKNYSRFKSNEKLMRAYIEENPKPNVQTDR